MFNVRLVLDLGDCFQVEEMLERQITLPFNAFPALTIELDDTGDVYGTVVVDTVNWMRTKQMLECYCSLQMVPDAVMDERIAELISRGWARLP